MMSLGRAKVCLYSDTVLETANRKMFGFGYPTLHIYFIQEVWVRVLKFSTAYSLDSTITGSRQQCYYLGCRSQFRRHFNRFPKP